MIASPERPSLSTRLAEGLARLDEVPSSGAKGSLPRKRSLLAQCAVRPCSGSAMGAHNGCMITAPEHDSSFCAAEMARSQCLELLGGAQIARVVLSIKCMPVALPVNVSLLGEDVIFSTDRGSKLTAAVEGQVVSVEADDIDLMYRTGWSVLVTGRAQLITEPADIEWASSRLQPWAPGPHPFLVRVSSTLISGRRLIWDAPQNNG